MNFKKYHVSNNLCPPISSANGWVIGYRNSSTGEYVANNNNREWLSPFFDIRDFPNGLVISADNSLSPNSMTVYYYNGDTYLTALSSTNYSGAVFTTIPNYTTRFCFAIRAAAQTEQEEIASGWRVWLNKGSTTLPYEPYSSEVWHDIPYYIHNTATDTITTLPAEVIADGNNATVGLVGNMSQTGTPSPTTPIQPQECGESTVNLAYGRINGANVNPNGVLARIEGYDVAIGRVESGVVYTVNSYVVAFYTNVPTIGSVSYDSSRIVGTLGIPTTFTAPITGYVAFRVESGEQAMLNAGSTPLPYEPYGVKIPILSNSTTTPVYLGEVESTRRIVKLVLDGNTSINDYAGAASKVGFVTQGAGILGNRTLGKCTHFQTQSTGVGSTIDGVTFGINNSIIYFTFSAASVAAYNLSDITSIKQYLADQYANGTPVTVWYVLATPETAVVNEPIRKIGTYADEVSGITIPTIAGANTLSIGTTLQPSEVSVNYHGWHPVQSVHERENGAWD